MGGVRQGSTQTGKRDRVKFGGGQGGQKNPRIKTPFKEDCLDGRQLTDASKGVEEPHRESHFCRVIKNATGDPKDPKLTYIQVQSFSISKRVSKLGLQGKRLGGMGNILAGLGPRSVGEKNSHQRRSGWSKTQTVSLWAETGCNTRKRTREVDQTEKKRQWHPRFRKGGLMISVNSERMEKKRGGKWVFRREGGKGKKDSGLGTQ